VKHVSKLTYRVESMGSASALAHGDFAMTYAGPGISIYCVELQSYGAASTLKSCIFRKDIGRDAD